MHETGFWVGGKCRNGGYVSSTMGRGKAWREGLNQYDFRFFVIRAKNWIGWRGQKQRLRKRTSKQKPYSLEREAPAIRGHKRTGETNHDGN